MNNASFAKLWLATFLGLSVVGGPAVQAAETKPSVSASKRWESEFTLWQKVSASSDPTGYQEYLKLYPSGTFASMARLRLAELNAAAGAKSASGDQKAAAESEKDKEQAAQKAAEAERLKAEEEAKIAAEKAKVEEERLAAEASRKQAEEAQRLRKEQEARAAAEAERAAEAKAEAERKAAEAERIRAEQAAEAARLKAEQEAMVAAEKAKAEEARLKAEQEEKAADEAKARADAAAADRVKAEEARAAAEAELKRAEEAAEAQRLKAEQEAQAADEARAKANEAVAEKAKAEAAQVGVEADGAAPDQSDVADSEVEKQNTSDAAERPQAETEGSVTTFVGKSADGKALEDAAKASDADAEKLARLEDNAWSRAVLNGKAASFQAYLNDYPNGRFAVEARQRLSAIGTKLSESPADEKVPESAPVAPSETVRQEPPATRKLQSKTTVFETAPDTREAYLEPGTRVQTQRWLNALGYSTGGADGVFGPRTRSAIASWQRSSGFRADGYLTRKQYRQLRQSAQVAESRSQERVARQRYQRRDPYYGGVYEGPVGGAYPEGGYYEGPVGGYYEGPVDGYYEGPAYRGDLGVSGPGY